jgi:uncharacterized membrane protein YfcA
MGDCGALALASIILVSGAAAAATGFGFNLLSTPLVTLFFPPQFAVVLTLWLGSVASGILVAPARTRRSIDWRLVRLLFLSSLLGMPAGSLVLTSGSSSGVRLLIAGLTALFAALMLARFRPRIGPGVGPLLTVGVLSGFLSTSTSLNGPLVAFYLLARDLPRNQFRANMIAFIFLASLASAVLLAAGGRISLGEQRDLFLLLLPALVLGIAGGLALARRLSQPRFETAVLVFLIVVGVLGVSQALR